MEKRNPNDFKIDLNNLHEEWLHQATLCDKYTELEAEAEKEKSEIRTRLDSEIREQDPKISESKLNNLIDIDAEYIEACYRVSIAKGDVKAIQHKKESLINEVTLWLGNYFSVSGLPKIVEGIDLKKIAVDRVTKRTRSRLNKQEEEE